MATSTVLSTPVFAGVSARIRTDMSIPRDEDDAFRWDGDDDPTLSSAPESVASAAGVAVPETVIAAEEPSDPEPAGIGNVALVAYGVLGGVYALWTAGWVIGALRLRDRIEGISGSVADFMFQGSMILAM